ncbi:MAG: dipeptidase [Bacteroidota bacterium]
MPRPVLLAVLALVLGCSETAPAQEPSRIARGPSDTVRVAPGSIPTGPIDALTIADTVLFADGGDVRLGEPLKSRLLAQDAENGDTLWQRALALHYDALVLDGHIDTPTLVLDDGYDFTRRYQRRRGSRHVDLPRMIEGGLDGAFFAAYVSSRYGEGEAATERARAMHRTFVEQVAQDERVELARTAADVRRITAAGRRAILWGLEGGHALQGDVEVLREFADLGIRYVTLTHVNTNAWADASQSRPRWGGLNDLGRDLVREMNRLGVLADVSHTSDETFYDALAVSQAPVIASHSSARAKVNAVRNLDDAMLRALAENGGVVMINFFDYVVNENLTQDVMDAALRRVRTEHGGNLRMYWTAVATEKRARGLPGGTWEDIIDHIDHAVQVAGVDHVGLGSDFDGVFALPEGMEDVTRLPRITYGLLKRGYAEDDIRKILGLNTLRVLEEAERVASSMQGIGE